MRSLKFSGELKNIYIILIPPEISNLQKKNLDFYYKHQKRISSKRDYFCLKACDFTKRKKNSIRLICANKNLSILNFNYDRNLTMS